MQDLTTSTAAGSTPSEITEIAPNIYAALRSQRGPWAGFKQICLVLIDGMGQQQLEAYRGHTPFLRKHLGPYIKTVTPSTTAAAITSLLTGKTPAQTKILGYEMRLPSGITSMIKFGGGPQSYLEAANYQVEPTLFEQLGGGVAATNPRFAHSGLSGAALRGSTTCGGKNFSERVDAAIAALSKGTEFVYLYSEDVDHAGHHDGPGSQAWLAALENTDMELARLARQLPGNCLLLITADHGMVHAQHTLDLAELSWADEIAEVAGESRAIHLFRSRANSEQLIGREEIAMGEQFYTAHREELSAWGNVFSRSEVASAWDLPPNDIRVPDVLVQALGDKRVIDSRWRSASAMKMQGEHGSITPAELQIPLICLA